MKDQKELKKAEAIGQIKTMPELATMPELPEQEIIVVDTPDQFQAAIGQAQMEGIEFVEVSERMFKYLLKNNKSHYLTYGNPGVKVYKAGTREEIESEEKMNAEAHHEYLAKKKQKHGSI